MAKEKGTEDLFPVGSQHQEDLPSAHHLQRIPKWPDLITDALSEKVRSGLMVAAWTRGLPQET